MRFISVMTDDPELKKELIKIKRRLVDIEKIVFPKTKTKSVEKKNANYNGLSGGIRLLINNKFFDKTKEVHEVILELEKRGYHYPKESIAKLLRIDFTTKQRLLNKIKDGKNYKYVIRK